MPQEPTLHQGSFLLQQMGEFTGNDNWSNFREEKTVACIWDICNTAPIAKAQGTLTARGRQHARAGGPGEMQRNSISGDAGMLHL